MNPAFSSTNTKGTMTFSQKIIRCPFSSTPPTNHLKRQDFEREWSPMETPNLPNQLLFRTAPIYSSPSPLSTAFSGVPPGIAGFSFAHPSVG